MGSHGHGLMNENGELFTDFCEQNDFVIGSTIFPHLNIHKITWISPDQKTKNQIDIWLYHSVADGCKNI